MTLLLHSLALHVALLGAALSSALCSFVLSLAASDFVDDGMLASVNVHTVMLPRLCKANLPPAALVP
jgi:hypothetical protein